LYLPIRAAARPAPARSTVPLAVLGLALALARRRGRAGSSLFISREN
jgi:hypothetical protein